jgi:hypothetical protein
MREKLSYPFRTAINFIGFEVLTAMIMKVTIFRVVIS